MHPAQEDFFRKVFDKYPKFRSNVTVLDVGSQDINGNNTRFFLPPYQYTGLDIGPGKNVDIVCAVHLYKPVTLYDVVISGEMLEHDRYWRESIPAMYHLTKFGGLFTFSCATTGRNIHGTKEISPLDSPHTTNYYHNLTEEEVRGLLDFDKFFSEYSFEVNDDHHDLYFYGIKRQLNVL